MIFENFLRMHGLNMQIERDGEIIATVPGLQTEKRQRTVSTLDFAQKPILK